MVAVKGTTLKTDFKNICERAYNGEVFIISRPKNRNVVIVSEQEYARLERFQKYADYFEKIDRAIAQKENGTMQEHELIEV